MAHIKNTPGRAPDTTAGCPEQGTLMTQDEDNLIDPGAACRMLSIDPDSLLRSINDGIVPAYSIGGAVRFRPSELRHPALAGLDEYYRRKDEHAAA